MGKKKQKQQPIVKEQNKHTKSGEDRGKKTYTLPGKPEGGTDSSEHLQKVSIPTGLEKEILNFIQEENKGKKLEKGLSKRLTSKKLTDMYTSLSEAGFSHNQIEQAMTNTVLHGGDLIDALDWLCLNLPNDKLPSGFSDTLQKEEDKVHVRPKFDTTLMREEKSLITQEDVNPLAVKKPLVQKGVGAIGQVDMKKWILQYAEQSDSDSVGEDEDGDQFDPNERYIELTALILDVKEEAAETKQIGNKAKQKELSKKIREIIVGEVTKRKHSW